MKYFSVIISVYLCFLEQYTFSQAQFGITSDCRNATEIAICQEGEIAMVSAEKPVFMDNNQNIITYYPGETKRSLWYKLYVNTNSKLTFTIYPTDTSDVYNYLLFKAPKDGDFCYDVMVKKIVPERVNFIEEKMAKGGVGLSHDAEISYQQSSRDSLRQVLYHTAYHKALYAQEGDVYYLIVYHQQGNDCGHYLTMHTDKYTANFHAVREKCVKELSSATALASFVTETTDCEKNKWDNTDNVSSIVLAKIIGQVWDSLTMMPLQAKIRYYDEKIGKEVTVSGDSLGNYELALEQKMLYKFTCSVIGYKEKTVNLLYTSIDSGYVRNDFYLMPLNAGEAFVLNDIYFYPNNYAFRTISMPTLNELVSFMKKNEYAVIEIQGHTNGEAKIKKKKKDKYLDEGWDFKGNEKKLSRFRAEAVKNYLVKHGIDKNRIYIVGFGAGKMLYPKPKNQTERDLNKRVEVVLLSTGKQISSSIKKSQ